jgi:TatD DNase family protein
MSIIETHAHIYDEGFNEDMEQMLSRAFEAGVEQIWMPNCNHETIDSMMALAKAFPDKCLPMIGLHPCYVKKDFEKEIQIIEDYLAKEKFIAIGEIGLDLYWDKTFLHNNRKHFYSNVLWQKSINFG